MDVGSGSVRLAVDCEAEAERAAGYASGDALVAGYAVQGVLVGEHESYGGVSAGDSVCPDEWVVEFVSRPQHERLREAEARPPETIQLALAGGS